MNILEWISSVFTRKGTSSITMADLGTELANAAGEYCFRELAFWSAVNLQAAALGQCEFRTYLGGKEVKKREYYLFNVQPNINQNRQEWLRELIAKLYRNNEALVILTDVGLVIADSFTRKPYALYEDVFTDVTVKDFTYSRSFVQSEVLYLRLNAADMNKVVEAVHGAYSKLLTYSMTSYQRSRGTKGIFNYDALPEAGTPQREVFDKLINERIGKWLNSDASALPLGKGQSWTELQHRTYSIESTRDIRAMTDDIQDFTAKAFGIPPPILRGDVQGTKDAVSLWLSTSIEPLADLLETEINRKRNGYKGFVRGDRVEIYTGNIMHYDLLSAAVSIDKLISSGFSPNEVRRICGEQQLDEQFANEHYITRNYTPDKTAEGGND